MWLAALIVHTHSLWVAIVLGFFFFLKNFASWVIAEAERIWWEKELYSPPFRILTEIGFLNIILALITRLLLFKNGKPQKERKGILSWPLFSSLDDKTH